MFASTINRENLNSGKDQLYKTLQLVQNKLKNHVVRTSLEKYLTGTNLLNSFERTTENIFTSIDKLDEKSIQNFNDHLNSFLQDTKDKTNISLYHVRIIDSMNFTIDNAPTYIRESAENDDFTSSEIIQQKNDNENIVPIVNEQDAVSLLAQHLLDIGYPKSSIQLDHSISQTKFRADITINYKNTILAVIEMKSSKKHESRDIGKLSTYYKHISNIQTFLPILFIVYYTEDLDKPYEYYISDKRLAKLHNFPRYLDLINQFNKKIMVSDNERDNQGSSKDINNSLQDAGNPAELGATNLTTVGSSGNTIGCYRIGTGWTYHSAPYQLTMDTYSILIEFNIEPSGDEKLIADSNLYAYEMLKFGKSGHDLSMGASNILHIWGTNTTAGAMWMDSVDGSGASDLQIWNYITTIHTNTDFNSKGHQQTVYIKDTKGRVTDVSFNVNTTSSSDLPTNTYASFQKDTPHEDDTDSLEIDEDINAFQNLNLKCNFLKFKN